MSNEVDGKTLKFAPLIRVSTEIQEKRGESLKTQRKQLEEAINSLRGTVYHWYEGQEHATPDQERKILDQLLMDAREGKFDAVMVAVKVLKPVESLFALIEYSTY